MTTNASQSTPVGGIVVARLSRDDHHALIQAQDTGISIALTEQPCIFDRSYRVRSDRSRHTGGAGLYGRVKLGTIPVPPSTKNSCRFNVE